MMMCGLISAEGQAPVGSSQNASDPLQEHYRAAASALANDDQQHAALQYKAFLAEALHRAANAEAQIGEAARASEHFAQALEFEPQDSALLDDYASLCFDRKELAKSEALLKDALTVNQSDTRAHFLLGRILFNQEKYLAAKPHLQAAFSTDREAWYLLGITYLKLHGLSSAQRLFKRIVATLSKKAPTLFRLGMAYATGDYPDEAITEFKRATTQHARAPDRHYYLALG